MEVSISFNNVSKSFKIYKDRAKTIKEFITKVKKSNYVINNVLANVSFDIYRGEYVAIIGKNGIGKSTILKMISKILHPDSGKIVVNGSVSSLLELGAGFDDDFTGRENIYFNASIFGMSRRNVDLIFEDIVGFSGIKDYIDFPIRTYSSGMYMRLAFSIAINMNADILIFDEILAVGDEEFQNKCMKKLRDLKQEGKTILFVSHDMEKVRKICDRAIWIENKNIKMDGNCNDVIDAYLRSEGSL